jgi:antitoxin component YwqK of YwqJK toxin-antitoxin module
MGRRFKRDDFMMVALIATLFCGCQADECIEVEWADYSSWHSSKLYFDDGSLQSILYRSPDSVKIVFQQFYANGAKRQELRKANEDIVYELSYYENETLELKYEPLCDKKLNTMAFSYSEYFPTGQLRCNGTYARVKGYYASFCSDSTKFDLHKDSLVDNMDTLPADALDAEVMVGRWETYYLNGKLASIKLYDTIYALCKSPAIIEGEQIGWMVEELPVKKGTWEYYDENGELLRKDLWINGRLIVQSEAIPSVPAQPISE